MSGNGVRASLCDSAGWQTPEAQQTLDEWQEGAHRQLEDAKNYPPNVGARCEDSTSIKQRKDRGFSSENVTMGTYGPCELEDLAAGLHKTIRRPEAECEFGEARETIDAAHGLRLHAAVRLTKILT